MKIEIKGPIISDGEQWIYDYFEIPATSPSAVTKLINKAEKNEELEVVINSGGGSVNSGSEIYTTLKEYDGDVVVKIVGIAASAASVIAMSGTKVMIAPTAGIMIHNASVSTGGNHSELEHTAGVLKTIDAGIANAYELKTGMKHEKLLALMEVETWFDAKKALDNKFVDEIMFTDTKIVASAQTLADGTLPQAVIDKIRNEKKKSSEGIIGSLHYVEPGPSATLDSERISELVLAKLKLKLK